jgi:hypothetical protein
MEVLFCEKMSSFKVNYKLFKELVIIGLSRGR